MGYSMFESWFLFRNFVNNLITVIEPSLVLKNIYTDLVVLSIYINIYKLRKF